MARNRRVTGNSESDIAVRRPLPMAPAAVCLLITLAGVAGCEVGPNYKRPETKVPAKWGEATTMAATTQPAHLEDWWKTFNDPVLDGLIDQAIKTNLSLRQAQDRVRQARAERTIAAAALWPVVDATGSYDRFRLSHNVVSVGPNASTRPAASRPVGGGPASGTPGSGAGAGAGLGNMNLFQAGFDATWEIDVFGKARRGLEASQANLAAAVEDRRDILVTLLAEVATNYMELRGAQQRLAIARSNVAAQRETVNLTTARLQQGTGTELDVSQAQAQLANLEAQLPGLETTVQQTMHQLSVLLGRQPMALAELAAETAAIPTSPPELPLILPSELLRRRPDVRRAERVLASATAEIGVAVADLFPQFSLNANVGLESSTLRKFTRPGSLYWSIIPSMSWQVFDGGSVRGNIQAKESQKQQAAAAYEQTVLTALQDVENALVAYAKERDHYQSLAKSLAAQKRSLDLATQLYTYGRTDYLSVLDAQRSFNTAEDALAQSRQSLASDVVSLYKALGGGWNSNQDRRDESASAATP